ncbi:hypothetical protein [Rhodopseudomonas sp. P2A-2r]|uniref:hypothetical protein n=1 Tax=unclassified Rhodopseudomonas TaxID=2638247 RepID=UPI0022340B2D|nr:hypothetical protein [Rhodopseudomonas sp. P2A-2r]UZE47604.1 hypothetical protein ONR75_22240 [Rhodopseudomonas sp. P2A-2r]
MRPPCPNCRYDMTATDLHNLFVCTPCRQIMQFFGTPADRSTPAQPRRLPAIDAVRPQPLHVEMSAAPAPRHTMSAPQASRQPLRRRA